MARGKFKPTKKQRQANQAKTIEKNVNSSVATTTSTSPNTMRQRRIDTPYGSIDDRKTTEEPLPLRSETQTPDQRVAGLPPWFQLHKWWPCRTYKWIRQLAMPAIRAVLRQDWHTTTILLVSLVAVFFAGWVAMEGLLHIFKMVSAQENCSIMYVTVPGPIITVSLVAVTPSDPARGTYYFSVINGTTQWLGSIAPPTRYTTVPSPTTASVVTPKTTHWATSISVPPKPTSTWMSSTVLVSTANSMSTFRSDKSSLSSAFITSTASTLVTPRQSASQSTESDSFQISLPNPSPGVSSQFPPTSESTVVPPPNISSTATLTSEGAAPSLTPPATAPPLSPSTSVMVSVPGTTASSQTSASSIPFSSVSVSISSSRSSLSNLPSTSTPQQKTTKVIAYGSEIFTFAFPPPDITTTMSYWTGAYPTTAGSEVISFNLTTRTARLSPISGLPSFDVFKASPTRLTTFTTTVISKAVAQTTTVVAAAEPTLCGEYGNFTLTFDDTTVDSKNDKIFSTNGMNNPYHHLFYANGYTYVPDKWEPYPAISQPNVAMFLPLTGKLLPNNAFAGSLLPGELGAGPRASVNAYWFNAWSGFFGCALNGITPCTLRISGFRYDAILKQEVVVAEQNVTISACWGYIGCRLTEVYFDDRFRALSGIQFNAYTYNLGIPQVFMLDNLNLEWYNSSCAAGILRIGHR